MSTDTIPSREVLFAAWRRGASATPINPARTAGEVRHQVTDAGSTVLVTDNAVEDHLGAPPLLTA